MQRQIFPALVLALLRGVRHARRGGAQGPNGKAYQRALGRRGSFSRAPEPQGFGGRGGNAKRADGPAAGSVLGSPPCHTRSAPPIPRPFRAHVPIGNFRIRIGSDPKIAHPTSTTRTCLNQTGAGLGLSVLLSCSCRSQQAQKCHNPGRTKNQKLYCRRVSDAFDEAPFGRALCNRP